VGFSVFENLKSHAQSASGQNLTLGTVGGVRSFGERLQPVQMFSWPASNADAPDSSGGRTL
jgi:hypothetical protein